MSNIVTKIRSNAKKAASIMGIGKTDNHGSKILRDLSFLFHNNVNINYLKDKDHDVLLEEDDYVVSKVSWELWEETSDIIEENEGLNISKEEISALAHMHHKTVENDLDLDIEDWPKGNEYIIITSK